MNSSYESEFIRNNARDLIDIDTKSNNTYISSIGLLAQNSFLFKGSLEQKKLNSTNSLTTELMKDVSNIGLPKIRKTEQEKFNDKIINKDKEKYKDSWIGIDSQNITKIILIKVVDQCYFEGHLRLKNNLDNEYIIIKFLNNKYYYMITPSIFFIKPRNEIIINIKMFFKLSPDTPLNKEKDTILMMAKKTINKIDDLNDVKIYLKDEDIYSQDYQLFSFSLILDNGYNPIYYDKLIEDRKKNIDAFYVKTNINEIKNINTIKEHIEDMKINIREYKNKIKKIEKEFELILEKIENQNIMNKENNKQEQINKIMVNKEEFFEVSEENKKGRTIEEINPNTLRKNVYDTFHDDNGVTIPMILFGMSLGLFLGKFIKNFFV
jgi:hypothetical protein